MWIFVALVVVAATSACAPRVRVRRDHVFPSLPEDCCPLRYGLSRPAPPGALLVGEARYGDTGLTTHCSNAEIQEMLRQQACRYGADAVKITWESVNSFESTCYRVNADLYRMEAAPDSSRTAAPIADADRAPCVAGAGLPDRLMKPVP